MGMLIKKCAKLPLIYRISGIPVHHFTINSLLQALKVLLFSAKA